MFDTTVTSPRLDAIRERRAQIAVELAKLSAENDALLIEQGRLEGEAAVRLEDPYLVGPQWLMAKLGVSKGGFYRLTGNKAKGFPEPVYLDSDPRWEWHKVKEWLKH